MAQRSTTGVPSAGIPAATQWLRSRTAGDVRAVAGVLAAVAVGLLTAIRIALNAPLGQSPAGVQTVYGAASAAAVVVPAGAAIAVGAVADSDWAMVGLFAAGVFALLAAVGPVAGLPAVGVLPVAALLVAVPLLARIRRGARFEGTFAGFAIAAVAVSLASSAGLLDSGARAVGTTAAFLALAVAPMAIGAGRRALASGLVAAVAVAAGAVAAPFVAGAVFLAVGAAIDPHLAIAAIGVGGGVAVVTAGALRREATFVAGGLLLLTAGVPATAPRALAVVLGVHLVLVAGGSEPTAAVTGGEPA